MKDDNMTNDQQRCSFELFKSNTCHRLKALGDIAFIADILKTGEIREIYAKEWYPEAFYLLAMLDYISRVNDVPLCNDYDELRRRKLSDPIFPTSILAIAQVNKNDAAKQQAIAEAIPEFLRFNIVECNVRDVV